MQWLAITRIALGLPGPIKLAIGGRSVHRRGSLTLGLGNVVNATTGFSRINTVLLRTRSRLGAAGKSALNETPTPTDAANGRHQTEETFRFRDLKRV